jgi:YfiR/HmsC-like
MWFLCKIVPRLLAHCLNMGLILILLANPFFTYAATSEQALTVAFLYNFLKFAQWPNGVMGDNLGLCVTDNADLIQELDHLAGKMAQDKPVLILRKSMNATLQGCQLLYLPATEKPLRVKQWLSNVGNQPILTVSNNDNFLELGGMIALVDDGEHLQFEVNLPPLKAAGLKLSAQLLKIARDVKGN